MKLTPREEAILEMRYEDNMRRIEVAKLFMVTSARIKAVEEKAIKKLVTEYFDKVKENLYLSIESDRLEN